MAAAQVSQTPLPPQSVVAMITNEYKPGKRVVEQAHPTQKRNLDKILVISPEGFGDGRWDKISKHLADYRPSLPKPQRISVNKYLLNFNQSKISPYIKDDRGLWQKALTRLRIWRGQARYEDFSQYDELFELLEQPTATPRPGEVACTLAHTKAWQEISSAKDICLVLEDDVELMPGRLSNQIDWPESCGFLHIYPLFLYHIAYVDDQFLRLLWLSPEKISEAEQSNWSLVGYLMTPEMARFLLERKPVINISIDGWLLNFMPKYTELFAYRQECLASIGTSMGSLISNLPARQFIHFLSRFKFYKYCVWLYHKMAPAWMHRIFSKFLDRRRNEWWHED